MSKYFFFHEGHWWDVVVRRKNPTETIPVHLVRYDQEEKLEERLLLCQLWHNKRFGWTVVVGGTDLKGVRLVEGFKTRWQAINYAMCIWRKGR